MVREPGGGRGLRRVRPQTLGQNYHPRRTPGDSNFAAARRPTPRVTHDVAPKNGPQSNGEVVQGLGDALTDDNQCRVW